MAGSAMASFTRGEALINVADQLGIDAFAPGNWEFSFAIYRYLQYFGTAADIEPINGDDWTTMAVGIPPFEQGHKASFGAPFPDAYRWGAVASNAYINGTKDVEAGVVDKGTGNLLTRPYKIMMVNGVKIGIVGSKTRRSYLSQWDHELLKVMAQWIADELERQLALEAHRRHETEFARVSRMSTIGEMAASLAHELNQPLTATINYSNSNSCLRMLKQPRPDTARLIQGLKRAVEGATMTADIIRHIRQFVQKGEEQYSAVNLNHAVRNAAGLISHEFQRHNVILTFELEVAIPVIDGNLIQIEQVILNFMRNSIEAMARVNQQHCLTVKTEMKASGMGTGCSYRQW